MKEEEIRLKLLELLREAETSDESSEFLKIQSWLNKIFDTIIHEKNWGALSLEHKTYAKTIEGMLRAVTQQPLQTSFNTLIRIMGEVLKLSLRPALMPTYQHHEHLIIPDKSVFKIKASYVKQQKEDYQAKAMNAILERKKDLEKINKAEYQEILLNARKQLEKGISISDLLKDRELLDTISTLSGHLTGNEKIIKKGDKLFLTTDKNQKSYSLKKLRKKTLIFETRGEERETNPEL